VGCVNNWDSWYCVIEAALFLVVSLELRDLSGQSEEQRAVTYVGQTCIQITELPPGRPQTVTHAFQGNAKGREQAYEV